MQQLAVIRRHAATFAVATVAAMVAAGGLAVAHDADGGGHDRFAHKANSADKAGMLKKIVIRRSDVDTVDVDAFKGMEVSCPPGYFASGGGAAGEVNGVQVTQSYPSDGTNNFKVGHTAWTVAVTNKSSTTRNFRAYVTCIPAGNVGSNFGAGDDPV